MAIETRMIIAHGTKDLRIEQQNVGEPGPGQVRLKMAVGGICGSDLHYYQHGGFGTVRLKEPMVLGHEVSGHIEALGDGVSNLTVGQLVAVSPSRPCHDCRFCDRGQHNHCLNMRFYGSAMPFPHIQGAFRQHLIADAAQCAPADGLTPAQAAMAEPLAVCLHAVRRVGEMLGKRVLITGCGPIGILCLLAARRAGAEEIVATDLSDYTLGMASLSGADTTVNTRENPDGLAPWHADKGQFDVLFECSGSPAALAGAVHALRPGAAIMQVGMGGDMTLPLQAMTAKEIRWTGSFRFHEEFHTGVALMQKGLIKVEPLISHTLPLDDAVAAFDLAGDRSRAMKVQIALN